MPRATNTPLDLVLAGPGLEEMLRLLAARLHDREDTLAIPRAWARG